MGKSDPNGPVPVLLVSGARSGVGKTRWVEALTRALTAEGFRVAVVKHHGHGGRLSPRKDGWRAGDPGAEMEQHQDHDGDEDKDTERARRAGAVERILVSEGRVLWEGTRRGESAASALQMALAILRLTDGQVDAVLAEGFRDVRGVPRLWVGPAPSNGRQGCGPEEGAFRVRGEDADSPGVVDDVLAWMRAYGIGVPELRPRSPQGQGSSMASGPGSTSASG